jgi:TorA maturation chaperone TorD
MDEEDQARAQVYGLLASLLVAPPSRERLQQLGAMEADAAGGDMAAAWNRLKGAAADASPDQLDDEYQALFIGLGRGELVPYASWYMTGLMMDRPLALLRRDLAALGIQRQADVHEPADHAAALCETMALIIESPQEISFESQRAFFNNHLAPWMSRFAIDLQAAESANFYRAVGEFGEKFMEIETQYFSMEV